MANKEVSLKVTLSLNEQWASNQTEEEVLSYLRDRLSTSLGFRGEVKKLKLVKR